MRSYGVSLLLELHEECLHRRIEANGWQRRDVNRVAHRLSSACNNALAAHQPAIAIKRRDTNQLGNLSLADAAQFRQIGQDETGRPQADPFERHEDIGFTGKYQISLQISFHSIDNCVALFDQEYNISSIQSLRVSFCSLRFFSSTIMCDNCL